MGTILDVQSEFVCDKPEFLCLTPILDNGKIVLILYDKRTCTSGYKLLSGMDLGASDKVTHRHIIFIRLFDVDFTLDSLYYLPSRLI